MSGRRITRDRFDWERDRLARLDNALSDTAGRPAEHGGQPCHADGPRWQPSPDAADQTVTRTFSDSRASIAA